VDHANHVGRGECEADSDPGRIDKGAGMTQDKRSKRDRHALDTDGMVLRNPATERPRTGPRWKASPRITLRA